MAVECGEHRNHDFSEGDRIYGAQLADGKDIAFCGVALVLIPEHERHAEQIPGGVDIHIGSSKAPPGSSSVSFADLKWGRRLFSIERATLIRYLPKVAELLLG